MTKYDIYRCPDCNNYYEVKHNWINFFKFGIEGSIWDCLGFAIKFSLIGLIYFYMGSYIIIHILTNPEVKQILSKLYGL